MWYNFTSERIQEIFMKHFFRGFVALWVVSWCMGANAACAGNTNRNTTVRIIPGEQPTQDIVGAPQVVSNTFILGNCGGQDYESYSVQPQGYYRQPTVYQRAGGPRPTNYYTGNGIETMPARRADVLREDYQRSRRTESRYSSDSSWNISGRGYVGAHLGLHLLNWRNTYHALPVEAIYDIGSDHDDYRFKPVIGGDLVLGYRFNQSWRTDIEFGFTSNYKDSDNGITFELSAPYVTGNIYYDFSNGLYLGLGAGAAFPTVSMEWENFTANNSSKTGASFIGAAMLGYGYHLSDSLILDLRYRISGFKGTSITRGVSHFGILQSVETSVGFVLDNSFSVGIRYEF